MGFGREVNDDVRGFDQRRGHWSVRDITVHKRVARIAGQVLQRFQPSCVGQFVQVGNVPVRMRGERMADEVASNKPAPPVTRTFVIYPSA